MKRIMLLMAGVLSLSMLAFVLGDAGSAGAAPLHPDWYGGWWGPGIWHPGWWAWGQWHPGWWGPGIWHPGWGGGWHPGWGGGWHHGWGGGWGWRRWH